MGPAKPSSRTVSRGLPGSDGGEARTLPARGPALVFALCGLAAAAVLAGGGPGLPGALLALPLVLGGAAFPLIARWSPAEPSALKVGLFAWLLSPFVLLVLFESARRALSVDAVPAAAVAFALAAALQPLVARARVGAEALGRAGLLAVAAGLAVAALLVGLHVAVPALRLAGDGLWHAGLFAACERAPAPANPWLAGTPIDHPLAFHTLGALLARALDLAPTHVSVFLAAWAAAALPVALYLLAAPLWLDGKRALLAVLLALLGWNASAGLDALLELAGAGALSSSSGAGPLATLVLPGPAAAALALAAASWLAAAHALRHGRRPWVGLCGLMAGLAFALDPEIGLAAALAAALSALLWPGAGVVRPALLFSLLLGLTPGLLLLRAGTGLGPELAAAPRPGPAAWIGAAALLPAALVGLFEARRSPAPGARSIAGLLASGALVAAALALVSPLPGAAPDGPPAAAALALGTLGGGLLGGRGAARTGRAALAGALGLGALSFLVLFPTALARRFDGDPAVRELPHGLAPLVRAGLDADAVLAYAWLRDELPFAAARPVLLLGEACEPQRLPVARAPHPAPLFSGLDLWSDRSEPSALAHPRLAPRVRAVRELLAPDGRPLTRPTIELERIGRPAVLWVSGADVARAQGLEGELARLGFAPLVCHGDVRLFVWPRELAEEHP